MFLICSNAGSTTPGMEVEPEKIELRLKWRQTWPDRENDFVAGTEAYQGPIGRIALEDGGGDKRGWWSWAFQARGPEIRLSSGTRSGYQPTAREAAREVERTWFEAIKGSRFDVKEAVPATPKNSYAAAKGR